MWIDALDEALRIPVQLLKRVELLRLLQRPKNPSEYLCRLHERFRYFLRQRKTKPVLSRSVLLVCGSVGLPCPTCLQWQIRAEHRRVDRIPVAKHLRALVLSHEARTKNLSSTRLRSVLPI